jgi:hypothetical protein
VTLDAGFRPHECTRTAELFRKSCDLDRRPQNTRVAASREGVRNYLLDGYCFSVPVQLRMTS